MGCRIEITHLNEAHEIEHFCSPRQKSAHFSPLCSPPMKLKLSPEAPRLDSSALSHKLIMVKQICEQLMNEDQNMHRIDMHVPKSGEWFGQMDIAFAFRIQKGMKSKFYRLKCPVPAAEGVIPIVTTVSSAINSAQSMKLKRKHLSRIAGIIASFDRRIDIVTFGSKHYCSVNRFAMNSLNF